MIDKIIEELEEKANNLMDWAEEEMNLEYIERAEAYREAIEIVKKYDNDGWISVKDKLPKENTNYIVTINDRYYGLSSETRCYSSDKGWIKYTDQGYILESDVIAFKPLPKPYKGE